MNSPLGPTAWQFVTPQLPVRDVRETQRYYRDVLGFNIAWIYEEEYGAVYNGATEIYFSVETGPITPSWNFVRVENADDVLAADRERDVKIVEDIASKPWGMREFTIEDNMATTFGSAIPRGQLGLQASEVRANE